MFTSAAAVLVLASAVLAAPVAPTNYFANISIDITYAGGYQSHLEGECCGWPDVLFTRERRIACCQVFVTDGGCGFPAVSVHSLSGRQLLPELEDVLGRLHRQHG